MGELELSELTGVVNGAAMLVFLTIGMIRVKPVLTSMVPLVVWTLVLLFLCMFMVGVMAPHLPRVPAESDGGSTVDQRPVIVGQLARYCGYGRGESAGRITIIC